MFCDISMKLLNYEHLNVLLGLNKKEIKDLKYKTSEKRRKIGKEISRRERKWEIRLQSV